MKEWKLNLKKNNAIKITITAITFFSLGLIANNLYNKKMELKYEYNRKIQDTKRNISESIVLASMLQNEKYSEVINSFDRMMYIRFSIVIGLSIPLNNAVQECNSDNTKKLLNYYQKYNKKIFEKSSKVCAEVAKNRGKKGTP
ncbi:hypothetical protein [Zooshikella harenae]|uniref:Uncharacterized protein n=1 Tax=Zooshikella harenae TaxID=2827238 RepID=A0ABS5ZJ79_9GAMM|nr:hypothetical protein [Zooshikella harenae]MBU2714144.1 hypothetical protein [Zooshikella harenae]